MPLSKIDSDSLSTPLTVPAGSAAAPAITTTGDTNTGIFFPAADTIAFAEGGVEAARFDASGRLLIGQTSSYDNATLCVTSPSQGFSLITDGGTTSNRSRGGFYHPSVNTFALNVDGASGVLAFTQNGTERARIDTSGNLQVGTTDQAFKLSVYETTNKVATAIRAVNASYSSSCLLIDAGPAASGGFQLIQARSNFNSSAQTVFYVFGNGNVQNTNNSYGAISDVKLKENIVDATPKLADLMQVKVRNYNLIGDTTKQIGVVAQELETVFPALVDVTPDTDVEGNDLGTTSKAVKYSVFVPMLIKAIQELKAIVDAQGAEIAALKGTP